MQTLESLWEAQSHLCHGCRGPHLRLCASAKPSAQITEADSGRKEAAGSAWFQFSFLFLYLSTSISFLVDSAILLG